MKSYSPIILLLLLAGCATQPHAERVVSEVPSRKIPPRELATIRTAEVVKAYPVGRYTDPNFPDVMHERHTVYRRERASNWNFQPSPPYALPLGPMVANSLTASTDFRKSLSEQADAQGKADAEMLREQNTELTDKIQSLQGIDAEAAKLRSEIESLKQQLRDQDERPAPSAPEPAAELDDFPLSDAPNVWPRRQSLQSS